MISIKHIKLHRFCIQVLNDFINQDSLLWTNRWRDCFALQIHVVFSLALSLVFSADPGISFCTVSAQKIRQKEENNFKTIGN